MLNSGPGWGTFILPYIEQSALADRVPRGAPFWGTTQAVSTPADGGQTPLKVFRCPSDFGPNLVAPQGNFAVSNYRATCGTLTTVLYPAEADLGGVLFQNSRVRIADILDGTSTTVMIGEGKSGVPRNVSTGNALSSGLWCGMTGNYDSNGVGVHIWIDNVMWPSGGNPAWPRDYVDEAFNSNHSEVVHFLFADGAVRGLSSKIDPALRAQLGLRKDALPREEP
jgi:hypothetical protein